MSTTPRTDEEAGIEDPKDNHPHWPVAYVPIAFARQLETELNESNAKLAAAEADAERLAKVLQDIHNNGEGSEVFPEHQDDPSYASWSRRFNLVVEALAAHEAWKNAPAIVDENQAEDAARFRWLMQQGFAWRDCYDSFWKEGEWLYTNANPRQYVDEARKGGNEV